LYTLSIVPSSPTPLRDDAHTTRDVIERHGGAASTADLRSELGLSERTLYRLLGKLVAEGSLFRDGKSRYTVRPPAASVSGEALQIVRVIEHVDAEAHLSGYDVLAGFAHQFAFDSPHLVCCHSPHLDGLAAALASKRFVVLAAGGGVLRGPLAPRTVLLRGQPPIRRRTLVHGSLATPEKAWVDLLRETRRSGLPIDYGELGRLLRAMIDHGINRRALFSYARRVGYLQWLGAATGERQPAGAQQRRLAAGYAA
jgi:DNA-binding IclR family transcriptional regulator